MKEVIIQNLRKFEIGSQENMNVPLWIVIGFQQTDRHDSQKLKNNTLCGLPNTSAQCIIGTEKNLDAGIFLNYDDDDYSQASGKIKQTFRALTKDDILQPYLSDHNFRSSNIRANDVGYKFYVFDIKYQQNCTASQPSKVKIKFAGVNPHDINGYALVLTKKLVSKYSDGQRRFDFI